MRQPAWLGWLLCFVSLLGHICCEEVFGILGENFTFPVKIDQKMDEILWTKNKNKVAEWDRSEVTYYDRFKKRSLLHENGSLTILNLENNDTGTYMIKHFDSEGKSYALTFELDVLAPPSEPEISCNISGVNLVLKCTADFQKPLDYTWKFSSLPPHHTQETVIHKKNVDASEKAECFIKFSQVKKSSEFYLTQCFSDTGDSYSGRSRIGLVVAFLLSIVFTLIVILRVLYKRRRMKLGTGRNSQNSPVRGSAEHQPLCSAETQEQPNADRGTASQAVCCENEEPAADEELNKEDSALTDEQLVNSGVNQEDTFKEENSSQLAGHGANEGDLES